MTALLARAFRPRIGPFRRHPGGSVAIPAQPFAHPRYAPPRHRFRGKPSMTSFFFVIRLALAWFIAFMVCVIAWNGVVENYRGPAWPFVLFCMALLGMVITGAFSHVRPVRLITGRVDSGNLSSRQRR